MGKVLMELVETGEVEEVDGCERSCSGFFVSRTKNFSFVQESLTHQNQIKPFNYRFAVDPPIWSAFSQSFNAFYGFVQNVYPHYSPTDNFHTGL